jgi:succinoglycan biosynthesis transport protein ExoP
MMEPPQQLKGEGEGGERPGDSVERGMTSPHESPSSPSLQGAPTPREYLAVAKRRAWVIILALVLTPTAAYFVSSSREPVYQASAEVLVGRPNLADTLNGIPESSDPERATATQAKLARLPELARRVVRAGGVTGQTVEEFLDSSSVAPSQGTDLLDFSVRSGDPQSAIRLATVYAQEFARYRRALDAEAIAGALRNIKARIADLESAGLAGSQIHTDLLEKRQQLVAREALATTTALVVQPGSEATKVQPRPMRSALLAAGLGLVLGIGLAFLAESLDTKVRTTEEIETRLGRPILARLPIRSRRGRRKREPVMIADPASTEAEAYRMLRASFEFAHFDSGARSVMVTSAVEDEGKSMTASNLAVALARAGWRTILCDLDCRNPSIAQSFGLNDQPGVTDVALGRADLEEALRTVVVSDSAHTHPSSNGDRTQSAVLQVLTLGTLIPPSPGEFVTSSAVALLLQELHGRGDIVVVDTPPILAASDAMVLSAKVDAMILVARLGVLRRGMLAGVEHAIRSSPARLLGIVVTGASETGYRSDYRAGNRRSSEVASSTHNLAE